jgi:hypothetical protein
MPSIRQTNDGGAKITLNEYLDRWLETAVKPRVREKTCQDYDGILQRYIRPAWVKEFWRQCGPWTSKLCGVARAALRNVYACPTVSERISPLGCCGILTPSEDRQATDDAKDSWLIDFLARC